MTSSNTDTIVLVTGGTGYLASWTILLLLQYGYTVRTTLRSLSRAPALLAALAAHTPHTGRLSVHQADLLADHGWDAATGGCHYVLHVASPLDRRTAPGASAAVDLVATAVQGTLRVMRASVKAGVRRVVMTSSVVACMVTDPGVMVSKTDEGTWADPQAAGVPLYNQSKTLAEQAAWAYLRENPGTRTTLATVLPSFILGPVLAPEVSLSLELVVRMLNGGIPLIPNVGFCFVDVRDVADLHVMAMVMPEAGGQRFVASTGWRMWREVAALLRQRLGDKAARVPTWQAPDFLIWLVGLVSVPGQFISSRLGKRHEFDCTKAQTMLGWKPRSVDDTIIECAESVIKAGLG